MCVFMALFILDRHYEVHGDDKFYMDIVKFFDIENPTFVSTYAHDEEMNSLNATFVSFIKYVPGTNVTEVANHIHELFTIDELGMLIFLDDGHFELLDILMNETRLFSKGATGLIQESDIDVKMCSSLRLDSKIYTYAPVENSTVIREMYEIKGKLITTNVATWNESIGLSVPIPNIWERRNDLGGLTLMVGSIDFPILHELHSDDSNKNALYGHGYLFEIINVLASKLNFTYKIIPSIDGKWGGTDTNGNWNGLTGMLIRKEVDMVAAALTITEERLSVTSFSVPFLEGYKTLISGKNLEPIADPWIYLNIFSIAAWFLCVVLFTIITMGFALMLHIDYVHATNTSEEFKILKGLGIALSFFRQIYCDMKMTGVSARILFLTSATSTYIIFVHYTAYLTAVSTTGIEDNPIRSFQDVIKSNYKVVVVDGSNEHELLKSSQPGTPMYHVYHNIIGKDSNAILQTYEGADYLFKKEKNSLLFGHSLLSIPYEGLTGLEIQG